MSAKISLREAALLSTAAYNGEIPRSWKELDKLSAGSSSCTILIDEDRKIVVFSFKGTDSFEEAWSDIANDGGERYIALHDSIQKYYLDTIEDYPDYDFVSTGHSLGGGMAQTFALYNGLDGFGQNALPVSQYAIGLLWPNESIDAKIAAYNSANSFQEVNVRGDIATAYYSGGHYLDADPVTLAHPVDEQLDALKIVVAAKMTLGVLGLGGILGTYLAYAGTAHSLTNVVKMLDSEVMVNDDDFSTIKDAVDLVSIDNLVIAENGDVSLNLNGVEFKLDVNLLSQVNVETPEDGGGEKITFERPDGTSGIVSAVYRDSTLAYYESVEAKVGGGVIIKIFDPMSSELVATADYVDSNNYKYTILGVIGDPQSEIDHPGPAWMKIPIYVHAGFNTNEQHPVSNNDTMYSEVIRSESGFLIRKYDQRNDDEWYLSQETHLDTDGTPLAFRQWGGGIGRLEVELLQGMEYAGLAPNYDFRYWFSNDGKPFIAPNIADMTLMANSPGPNPPSDDNELPGDEDGGAIIVPSDYDDVLIGDWRDNVLNGGKGNDHLEGKDGSDLYVFQRGDGLDLIVEGKGYADDLDVIHFGDSIDVSDISLRHILNDLVINIPGENNMITIQDWFLGRGREIEKIEFDSGAVWDADLLSEKIASLNHLGSAGDDQLSGDYLNNGFDAGKGNDITEGYEGSDRYYFKKEDGKDTIYEYSYESSDKDTIIFGGDISDTDIILARDGSDIVISIRGTNDSIRVVDWGSSKIFGIEEFVFDSGMVWSEEVIDEKILNLKYVGSDTYDKLVGNEYANTFIGGHGDDLIIGGEGSDIYLYTKGDGNDRIFEYQYDTGVDTIRFDSSISPDDIFVSIVESDLVLSIAGSGDSITIESWTYAGPRPIELIEFSDNTVWDAATLDRKVATSGYDGNEWLSESFLTFVPVTTVSEV